MTEDEELFEMLAEVLGGFTTEGELVEYLRGTASLPEGRIRDGPLGSALIRHLYDEPDSLVLTLRAHLYIENFIDTILKRKFKHASIILKNRDFSFSMKLDVLRANNQMDEDLYHDIRLLNRLRNKFAHELHFAFHSFAFGQFTYCERFGQVLNRVKGVEARNLLCVFIFRHVAMEMLFRLTKRHKYIAEPQQPT
jgi:hypothetical protein